MPEEKPDEKDKKFMEDLEKRTIEYEEITSVVPDTAKLMSGPPEELATAILSLFSTSLGIIGIKVFKGKDIEVTIKRAKNSTASLLSPDAMKEQNVNEITVEITQCPHCGVRYVQKYPSEPIKCKTEGCMKDGKPSQTVFLGTAKWDKVKIPVSTPDFVKWLKDLKFE